MTVTIEIINEGAFYLLSGMEGLGLIKMNNSYKIECPTGEKLSEQFAGALNISDSIYETYQKNLKESRNEWTRVTY